MPANVSLFGILQIFREKEMKGDKHSRCMAVTEFLIIYYLFLFGASKYYTAWDYNTAHCFTWVRKLFFSCEGITNAEDLSRNGIMNNSG
jgi:hypothetical protein